MRVSHAGRAARVLPLLLALLVLVGRVDAQPRGRPSDVTQLLRAAARERANGMVRAALDDYRAACQNVRSVACLEGVGAMSAALGLYPDSIAAYEDLAAARDASLGAQNTARQRVRDLSNRVATLRIVVEEPGAQVSLDGRPLGTGPLTISARVLPGAHSVVASRPRKAPLSKSVVVEARGVETIELRETAGAAASPDGKAAGTAAAGSTPPQDNGAPDAVVVSGKKTYRPLRVTTPPKIDGLLDEEMWAKAPRDTGFNSVVSKPYGAPAKNPTEVLVAYDERYLYVAFRCRYDGPGVRDDSLPLDESSALANAEIIGFHIDARNDKSSARFFAVTRTGARIDEDRVYNSANANLEWRGVWDVGTQRSADLWTAEFAVPWGTAGATGHAEEFSVGINFERAVPSDDYESTMWDLPPPGLAGDPPPSLFGHLVGMTNVKPHLQLFLQPYLAMAFQRGGEDPVTGAPPPPLSTLRDFTGTDGNLTTYAGLYLRFRPPGPVSIDATINPDFSQVQPDQALTNSDRFELFRPEFRPFFAEDRGRFEFGPDEARVFYTRRIGLQLGANGISREVPIIYGVKGIVRGGSTEVAVMNVETSSPAKRVSFDENVTVIKANHLFENGRRLGNILMRRRDREGKDHLVGGVEGVWTAYDQHLRAYGYLARSTTEASTGPFAHCGPNTPDRACGGFLGGARLGWASNEFQAGGGHTEVSSGYDPQLGFVPIADVADGARISTFDTNYTPLVRNDYVSRGRLSAILTHATNTRDTLVYERAGVGLGAYMTNDAFVNISATSSRDLVSNPFRLVGNGEVQVPAGEYQTLTFLGTISTPPRRVVELSLVYREGGLFGGYQRNPIAIVGFNLGRFSQSTTYSYYILRGAGGERAKAHQLQLATQVAYTPLARSVLAVEASTFNPYAAAQLTNSIQFGQLSTLSLVFSQRGQDVESWFRKPEQRILLSFIYGLSPF